MPLPAVKPTKNIRLCIYGDSHLACLKNALEQGLVESERYDIEFWGAFGPYFRSLRMKDGAIHPDPDALEQVEMVNQSGRTSLSPTEFDAMLFMGARLRVSDFLTAFLDQLTKDSGHLTRAAMIVACQNWMNKTRSYRFAKEFAAAGSTQILYSPTPLHSDGVIENHLEKFGNAKLATAKQRDFVWDCLIAAAAQDGVQLLRQSSDTIVNGLMTHDKFTLDGAKDKRDSTHKNAAFGATVLADAFDRIGSGLN